MPKNEAVRLMDFYPKIYFACHTKHVSDPDTGTKLTAKQASVLDHLDIKEPVTLFDLAMHMGVTPSTMSLSIDRLAGMGYVRRERDKIDGRKTHLTLTSQGDKIKKANSVLDLAAVEALLNRLSPTERKLALDGLGLLAYAADMEMKSRSLQKSWNNRKNK
jgi:MarR family transcriptional regulator, organic hydroperoxide resistance regulator